MYEIENYIGTPGSMGSRCMILHDKIEKKKKKTKKNPPTTTNIRTFSLVHIYNTLRQWENPDSFELAVHISVLRKHNKIAIVPFLRDFSKVLNC